MMDIDVETILATHPHIDRTRLEKSLQLGEQLKRAGLSSKGYSLQSPDRVRRIVIQHVQSTGPKSSLTQLAGS